MILLMNNKLAQLLLNACYMHSGALVYVVTGVINSKAAEKLNWDYNWQLDFNSCLSASEIGSDVEKVVMKWWTCAVHSQLCVSAVSTLVGRMLLDVHRHLCSHDGFSDSDLDACVDKVNSMTTSLYRKDYYPDSDGTPTLCGASQNFSVNSHRKIR